MTESLLAHFYFAMISDLKLKRLQYMIAAGTSDDFYDWGDWLQVRNDVLRLDKRECQACKERHRYEKAIIVHHVKHLKDRPDLALSIYDPDTGERQLVSLCRACHEDQHPDRRCKTATRAKRMVTVERWD